MKLTCEARALGACLFYGPGDQITFPTSVAVLAREIFIRPFHFKMSKVEPQK